MKFQDLPQLNGFECEVGKMKFQGIKLNIYQKDNALNWASALPCHIDIETEVKDLGRIGLKSEMSLSKAREIIKEIPSKNYSFSLREPKVELVGNFTLQQLKAIVSIMED